MAKLLSGYIDEKNALDVVRQMVIKLNEIETGNRREIARLKTELSQKISDLDNKLIAHLTDASYNERSSGAD